MGVAWLGRRCWGLLRRVLPKVGKWVPTRACGQYAANSGRAIQRLIVLLTLKIIPKGLFNGTQLCKNVRRMEVVSTSSRFGVMTESDSVWQAAGDGPETTLRPARETQGEGNSLSRGLSLTTSEAAANLLTFRS